MMGYVNGSMDPTGWMPVANLILYFDQSNLAGKAIVLILVLFSLFAWTVMLGKYLDLERWRKENRLCAERLEATEKLLRIDPRLPDASGPFVRLTRAGLAAAREAPRKDRAMGYVENALHRAVAVLSARYEDRMVILGSIVSGAPFLGLLGTVWGVMDAFGSVTGEQAVSLGMLAPGVSGALLTTVAGLLVAIPSVFGYNYLLARVRVMITDLENYASIIADRIELELTE